MLRKEMCETLTDFFNNYPISQREFAKTAKVTYNTINEIMRNAKPTAKMLSKTVVKISKTIDKFKGEYNA